MSKIDSIAVIAVVAVGAFLYFKFRGTSEDNRASIKASMDTSRTPTQEEIARNWTAGKSSLITTNESLGKNTTYFFTQEDLNKVNWAQRFLLNVGVSPSVVF